MKKKVKVLIILFILLIVYLYVCNISFFPKNILLIQGEKIDLRTMWGLSFKERGNLLSKKTTEASYFINEENRQVGKQDLDLNLFHIPVSQVSVNIISKRKVIPLRMCCWFKALYKRSISCWNESNRWNKAL